MQESHSAEGHVALLQQDGKALLEEARAYEVASKDGVAVAVRSSEEQVARLRDEASAYRHDLDVQRVSLQAIEHSEHSTVSALQDQIVSQSEMVEQRDDRLRGQIVDLTTRLALAERRPEDKRELKAAAIAVADLRVENYRLEWAAEQSRAQLVEMEGRQLATQLPGEVDHHRRYSEWYREMVPAQILPHPQVPPPDPPGPLAQSSGLGTAIRPGAARLPIIPDGKWMRR